MTLDIFVIGVIASFGIYLASLVILKCVQTPFVKRNIGRWLLVTLVILWICIITLMVLQEHGLGI